MDLASLGRLLLLFAALLGLLGLALLAGSRIPLLGRLPGDLNLRWDGGSFYFPLVTCLVLSVVVSILFNLVAWFLKRS